MSQNKHIDLIEFPAESTPERDTLKNFLSLVFNWEFTDYGDDYSDTHSSGLTLGINATAGKKQSMPLVILYVENLEETKEAVVKAGGKLLTEIYSFPGGRRFHFSDPTGHEFAAWSE